MRGKAALQDFLFKADTEPMVKTWQMVNTV